MSAERVKIAQAFHDGFLAALGCRPWEDASDFAILVGQLYAEGKPLPSTMPTPVLTPDGGALWQPIETIPTDGTKVLAGRFTGNPKADQEGRQAVDFWHNRAKHGYDGLGQFNSHFWPATHWMPRPTPPAPAGDR